MTRQMNLFPTRECPCCNSGYVSGRVGRGPVQRVKCAVCKGTGEIPVE